MERSANRDFIRHLRDPICGLRRCPVLAGRRRDPTTPGVEAKGRGCRSVVWILHRIGVERCGILSPNLLPNRPRLDSHPLGVDDVTGNHRHHHWDIDPRERVSPKPPLALKN